MTPLPALPPVGLPPFHRPDINGLRAIAILAVVGFHLAPNWVRGGYLGVDVFFVISGYLITGIIWREKTQGRFSFWQFCLNRARRLMPTLGVVLLFTVGTGWVIMLPDEFRNLGGHLIAACVFLTNAVLWSEAGYFDTAATTKPLLHLWSLAVEAQFYLVWPGMLAILMRLRPVHRVWALGGLGLASWALMLCWGGQGGAAAVFYSPLTRLWAFMAGAAVALVHAGATPLPPVWVPSGRARSPETRPAAMGASVGLVLVGVSVIGTPAHGEAPAWWALAPVVGTVLCLVHRPAPGRIQRALTWPVVTWIGGLSYALYLWHWPLLVFARLIESDYPHFSVRLLMLGVALILADLCTRHWEARFRRSAGVRRPASLHGVAVFWGLMLGVGMLVAVGALEPRLNDLLVQRLAAAVGDWDHPGALTRRSVEDVPMTSQSGSDRRVVMWGDSHIEQYGPRLSALASERGDAMPTVDMFTDWACPPILGVEDPSLPNCKRLHDVAWRQALQADVDTVVVGGCWACYFLGEMKPIPDPTDPYRFVIHFEGRTVDFRDPHGAAREQVMAALQRTLSELKWAGKRVYLLLDNPSGEAFSPVHFVQGSRWSGMTAQAMPTHTAVDEAQWTLHEDLRAVAARAGVMVLDPWPTLCPKRPQCWRASPQGHPLYKDDNHLRPWVVREWAAYFDAALTP